MQYKIEYFSLCHRCHITNSCSRALPLMMIMWDLTSSDAGLTYKGQESLLPQGISTRPKLWFLCTAACHSTTTLSPNRLSVNQGHIACHMTVTWCFMPRQPLHIRAMPYDMFSDVLDHVIIRQCDQ